MDELRLRIKICCIASLGEARRAAAAGAELLGLVSRMPSGPGSIPESRIRRIAEAAPAGVETVLLTAEREADAIAAQHGRCRTGAIQLVDRLTRRELERLATRLPGVPLMAVVHVVGPESVDEARAVAEVADRLLLDSGDPGLPVKELGGTGRVHDWAISREIVAAVPVPVFLAGGLRPDNVGEAIRQVAPAGVDVCSGVRSAGRLDPDRLDAFVGAARASWSSRS